MLTKLARLIPNDDLPLRLGAKVIISKTPDDPPPVAQRLRYTCGEPNCPVCPRS